MTHLKITKCVVWFSLQRL